MMPDDNGIRHLLNRDIKDLPGIASRRAELLDKIGIRTWFDLLTWFPRDYEDWSECQPLSTIKEQAEISFLAYPARKPVSRRKGRLTIIQVDLADESGTIQAVWFNQPWLPQQIKPGQWYQFRGKIAIRGRQFFAQNPSFVEIDRNNPENQGIKPVYRLTSGLSQGIMRKLMNTLLPLIQGNIPEPLPASVRREHKLCAVEYAYGKIHLPSSWEEASVCRRRLVFEEFFLLQASLYMLRCENRQQVRSFCIDPDTEARNKWQSAVDNLPFRLTNAQTKVLREIENDLRQDKPMNRLVQGDVGSGKTVVAVLAMLLAALEGHQSVMMAPTSILARQHYQTVSGLLAGCQVNIALLTGSAAAADRRKILNELAGGQIDILIGTHAVIEEKVLFKSLALAVTDEQHRFGVRQRLKLAGQDKSGIQPHILVMTATPIPRSLALVVYGDLDISVIDEKPAGRQPVRTYTADSRARSRVDKLLRTAIDNNNQAYIVCPMIEDDNGQEMESVISTYNRLSNEVLPDCSVSLLHGKLSQSEKDRIMDDFTAGEINALVSTTVIEVGVDNPNATLMIIENAERFGLAQLHQLRGRIGRGKGSSLCVLMSDAADKTAKERLKVLCLSGDGFVIAEKDLELRGPGDFFGTRQHGLPDLRIARIYQDIDLLQAARNSLNKITAEDPGLEKWENRKIRQVIQARFGRFFWQPGL